MEELTLKAIVEAEIDNAIGYIETETVEQRAKAIDGVWFASAHVPVARIEVFSLSAMGARQQLHPISYHWESPG